MRKIYVFIVFVICLSCNKKTNKFDFPKTESLVYSSLIFDENLVLNPLVFELFDSIVLVNDPYDGYHFSVINANTKTLLFRSGKNGRGPEEFLYPIILEKMSDSILQIVDCAAQKVCLYHIREIIDKQLFEANHTVYFKDIPLKEGEFINFLYHLAEDTLIAVGFFHESKYAMCYLDSMKNINVEYVLDYHKDSRSDHTFSRLSEYTAYQGILHINAHRNTVLYHSPLAHYFQVFHVGRNIEELSSYFRPANYIVGDDGYAIMIGENENGFLWGDISNNKIFLLNKERSHTEYGSDAFLSDQILVMDYLGNNIVKYLLDIDIKSFIVDEKEQKIYVIALNPKTDQFEIGFFKFN